MKAFVIYGPETREHVEIARRLAIDLLDRRIDCEVDVLAKTPAEGWRTWTEQRVAAADVVLLLVSPAFVKRIDAAVALGALGGRAGPRQDAKLIAGLLARAAAGERRALVVLPDDVAEEHVPGAASSAPRFRYPSQVAELAASLTPPPAAATRVSSGAGARVTAVPSSAPSSSSRRRGLRTQESVSPITASKVQSYLEAVLGVYERMSKGMHLVRPSADGAAGVVPDLIEHARAAVVRDPGAMLLVLGEYGTGKTVVARRLAYELGQDALAGHPDAVLPFYLNLSFAKNKPNLVKAISLFIGRYGVRIPEAALLELFRSTGRVVLVLDGLDELGVRIKRDETPKFIAALAELRAIPGLRVVLTCRSTFFKDSIDEDQIPATEKLTVKPFDDRQIGAYLDLAPADARQRMTAMLERVPRLRELCRTPIHLFLSQEYLADHADLDADFRLIDLYDVFVKKNIAVHATGNPGWSPAARRDFVRRLLYKMFDEGLFEVTLADLTRLLAAEMPAAGSEEVADMAAQIANASFFSRIGDNLYPVHFSFLEYFVSEALVADLYEGKLDRWNRRPLYAEVFDFMIQMIQRRGVEKLPVRAVAASPKEEAPSNFLATMYRWPVPAVRPTFEELLLDGTFPLVRCVACQGVGMYDTVEIVPTLLAAFDRETSSIIKATVQRLLERLVDRVEPGPARAVVAARLAVPVSLLADDAEAILHVRQNNFALTAYRKAMLLGDRRPSSTIAAIYLLAGAGDAESFPAMAAIVARAETPAIRSAYAHARELVELPLLD